MPLNAIAYETGPIALEFPASSPRQPIATLTNITKRYGNTLALDKNATREDALIDIYRVMRPGEPPTLETAEVLFNGLFFDSERYDLSAVGRVKMNSRLALDTDDSVRVLRKADILAVVKALVDLAVQTYGGLDFMHANAADLKVVLSDTNAVDVPLEVFDRTIAVNLRGHLLC